ncbi:MAG: alpha/beta hydrolase, partial [Candidatus Jordarchaeaceae archaeon]
MKILGLLIMLGFLLFPTVNSSVLSNTLNLSTAGNILIANNMVKIINSGIENHARMLPSEAYNISLLQQIQINTPDHKLTTEIQNIQQDWSQVNTQNELTVKEEFTFTVTAWDGYPLPAKLWTKYPNQNQPLVVLVHGLYCDLEQWPLVFSGLWEGLLDRGYTVVAYTQRNRGDPVPHFSYLIRDLSDVIRKAITDYDSHIDENNVGLVGHSLGSYVVTMAACSDMSCLIGGDIYSKIKIVVEGNGPDNLQEAADWIILTPGDLVDNWAKRHYTLIMQATQPIDYAKGYSYQGHPWCVALESGWDHVDSIIIPFWVYHDYWDSVIPW